MDGKLIDLYFVPALLFLSGIYILLIASGKMEFTGSEKHKKWQKAHPKIMIMSGVSGILMGIYYFFEYSNIYSIK